MADKRYSIIVENFDKCLVCGSYIDINKHEIFFGQKHRQLSIKYGLVVPLCGRHHNKSNDGVHFNSELNKNLKKLGQRAFIKTYPDLDFLSIFHKNYLTGEEDDL